MTIEELEDLVGRFGEDPVRWPDEARPAALRLVATSDAARALIDEHRALRTRLADTAVPRPSPDLLDRILDAAFEGDRPGAGRRRDRQDR